MELANSEALHQLILEGLKDTEDDQLFQKIIDGTINSGLAESNQKLSRMIGVTPSIIDRWRSGRNLAHYAMRRVIYMHLLNLLSIQLHIKNRLNNP